MDGLSISICLFIAFFIAGILLSMAVDNVKEKKARREAYIAELEKTVERQARSLRAYRLNKMLEEIEKENKAGAYIEKE